MAKRIILISSFPICVALVIIALVLAGVGHGQPAVSKPVLSAVERVELPASTPVNSGKLDDANAAADKLITDYAKNANLSSTLTDAANQCAWDRKYDNAKKLYRAVVDKNPNNSFVTKASLGLARLNVLTLIEQKNYALAQQQVESMAVDFNSEPNLPESLFHIGKEFTWQHRYIEAKDTLALIVDKPVADSFSKEIQLWSARANVCSLISKASDTEVVAAIDKLMTDFAGNAGLAEAVYWISKEYEWKKGTSINRAGWYDTPNSVYQKIMQEFSDTPYGQEAEWDQKRLSHRMKIFKLMQEPNQAATDAAIEAMITDLKGRPELAGELYWIACGYEEHSDKLSQAEEIYARIVKDCPGTDEADRAALDVRRRVLCELFDAGDPNASTALLDSFVADYKQHPYAGACLGRAEIGFYTRATEFREQKQAENARKYAEKAADVWQRISKNDLSMGTDSVYLYFYAGANYLELQRWDEAIESFQKVVDNWPDFEYACVAQAAIGGSYETLRDSGSAPKEAVNPLIEDSYKAILANYPNCYAINEVSYRLAGMMLDKGDKADAIKYYQKFLDSAKAPQFGLPANAKCGSSKKQDDRVEAVKAKLAELTAEGGNN